MQADKGHNRGQKRNVTEADVKSAGGKSGRRLGSGHDDKRHEKAGGDTGAGGGRKQERHLGH